MLMIGLSVINNYLAMTKQTEEKLSNSFIIIKKKRQHILVAENEGQINRKRYYIEKLKTFVQAPEDELLVSDENYGEALVNLFQRNE